MAQTCSGRSSLGLTRKILTLQRPAETNGCWVSSRLHHMSVQLLSLLGLRSFQFDSSAALFSDVGRPLCFGAIVDSTGIFHVTGWLTDPLNRCFGRRGTIFIPALISSVADSPWMTSVHSEVYRFLTCIWSGLTNTWYHLFIARFCLGLGIGPKSGGSPHLPMLSADKPP